MLEICASGSFSSLKEIVSLLALPYLFVDVRSFELVIISVASGVLSCNYIFMHFMQPIEVVCISGFPK